MPFLFLSLPFFFIQRERNEDARLTVGRSRKQHFESKVLTLPNKERYNYILYYDRFWIEEINIVGMIWRCPSDYLVCRTIVLVSGGRLTDRLGSEDPPSPSISMGRHPQSSGGGGPDPEPFFYFSFAMNWLPFFYGVGVEIEPGTNLLPCWTLSALPILFILSISTRLVTHQMAPSFYVR